MNGDRDRRSLIDGTCHQVSERSEIMIFGLSVTGDAMKEKDQVGHESHGGRHDLEPAAPDAASHDAMVRRIATLEDALKAATEQLARIHAYAEWGD